MDTPFSNTFLDSCRQRQDDLADRVIAHYFPKDRQALKDLLDAVVDNAFEPDDKLPESFCQLHYEVFQSPLLRQEKLIEKGQEFFAKHSADILLLLGFLSLPYCYAAAKGAEVLIRSKRILEEPETRLAETAQFVFDVMAEDAFAKEGKGLASILKVRLMHAAIRYYLNQDKDWLTDYGKPVNQEDMAGTNLSFSLIPIRGLRKLGKTVPAQESMDYVAYWNLIGALLGLAPDLLPDSNKSAYLLERNIRQRQFEYSEAGARLTSSLMGYFDQVTKDSPLENRARPFVHYLLGERVARHVGLEVSKSESGRFQPFAQYLRLKNIITAKEDTYLAAYRQFQQQQETSGQEVRLQFKT